MTAIPETHAQTPPCRLCGTRLVRVSDGEPVDEIWWYACPRCEGIAGGVGDIEDWFSYDRDDLGAAMRYGNQMAEEGHLQRALRVFYEIERTCGAWFAELARRRGNVLADLGRHDDALQSYALARRRGWDDAELALLISMNEAQIYADRGDCGRAVSVLREVAVSPRLTDALAGPVHLALGSALAECGDVVGAGEVFRGVICLAEEAGDLAVAARAWFKTGNVLTSADELGAAEEAYRTARALFTQLGEPGADADCVDALGTVMAYRNRFPEALALHDAARGVYQILQRPVDLAIAEQNYSWALFNLGRPAEALSASARAVSLYVSAGQTTAAWCAELSTIPALCELGRIQDARELIQVTIVARPALIANDGAYLAWMTAWLSHYDGDEALCRAGRLLAAQTFSSRGSFAAAREALDLPHPARES